jgi:hypothetical protein
LIPICLNRSGARAGIFGTRAEQGVFHDLDLIAVFVAQGWHVFIRCALLGSRVGFRLAEGIGTLKSRYVIVSSG